MKIFSHLRPSIDLALVISAPWLLALSACGGESPKPGSAISSKHEALALTAPATPSYFPISVVGPYDGVSIDVRDINNSGVTVGTVVRVGNPDPETHAFTHTDAGGLVELEVPAPNQSRGLGINDKGEVAGTLTTTRWYNWTEFGFRRAPDGTVTTLTPGIFYGSAINEAGQVAGYGYNAEGLIAWRATGTTFEDLRFLDGSGYEASATTLGIGPGGEVVGYNLLSDGATQHAFIYRDGQGMADLNSFSKDSAWVLQLAWATNGRYVVGDGILAGQTHGFRLDLSNGALVDLGQTTPRAVNSAGHVAGWSFFYSDETGLVSLPEKIDPGAGWSNFQVNGMNDQDELVGVGTKDGHPTGFKVRVLKAITEPATCVGPQAPDLTNYSSTPADPAPSPQEPTVGAPFTGALAGDLSVGASGAVTYSVPITVPPGLAGMAPNLSLVYSSQGSDGIAGQGFQLAGLSMIYRCAKTRAQDGFARAVEMAADQDGYCLDGKRLFQRGTLGFETIYEPEQADAAPLGSVEDFRLERILRSSDGLSFRAISKTGEVRYYGRRQQSRVVLPDARPSAGLVIAAWPLDRVMDTWGNYFDVEYNKDNADFTSAGIAVSRIDYTGRTATVDQAAQRSEGEVGTFYSVSFDYEARPDHRRLRFGNSTLDRSLRLTAISTPLGKYTLSYLPDNDLTLPSRLDTIQYCLGAGCSSPAVTDPKPLVFGWDWGSYGWEAAPNYALPGAVQGSFAPLASGAQFVDLNGDGRTDFLIARGRSEDGAWENNGSGWTRHSNWKLPAQLAASGPTGTRMGTLLADLDGDGLPDLFSDAPHAWLNRTRQGSGWEPDVLFESIPASWGKLNFLTTDTLADMNGDGRADLVRIGLGDADRLQVLLNTGSGWVAAPASYSAFFPIRDYRVQDFNRDGLADLVPAQGSSLQLGGLMNTGDGATGTPGLGIFKRVLTVDPAPPNLPSPTVGDVDGDGFPDLVRIAKPNVSPQGALSFSSGFGYTKDRSDSYLTAVTAQFTAPPIQNIPDYRLTSSDYNFVLADLNADGLADIVKNHPRDGGQFLVNTGQTWQDLNGQNSWQISAGPNPVPAVPAAAASVVATSAVFVDFDGDGVTDLVQSSPFSNTNEAWHNKFRPPVIAHFPSGLAQNSDVSYVVLTAAAAQSLYSDSNARAAQNTFAMTPLRVAASVSKDTGTGIMSRTDYSYRDFRGSAIGRGLQGFASMTSIEQVSGVKTITTYAQAYPYTGMVTSVARQYLSAGNRGTWTQTNTSYCDAPPDQPGVLCTPITGAGTPPPALTSVFVYPTKITDRTFLPTTLAPGQLRSTESTLTTTEFSYDVHGNPARTAVTTQSADGEQYQKETVNIYGTPPGPEWQMNKLTRSVVTTRKLAPLDGTANVVRTTEFDYRVVAVPLPWQEATVGLSPLALVKKREEPLAGAGMELHTAYAYDLFGNITVSTACASDFGECAPNAKGPSDVPFRTTQISFDPADFTPNANFAGRLPYDRGRFPVKTSNALGHVEYSAYQPLFGKLSQQIGANGIATCYQYDGLGRQIRETAQCGSSKQISTTSLQNEPGGGFGSILAKVVTVTRAPTGVATWVFSDAFGRALSTVSRSFDGTLIDAETSYDALGRVQLTSKPFLVGQPEYDTVTSYDAVGRLSSSSQHLGQLDGTASLVRADASLVSTTTYQGSLVTTTTTINGEVHTRSEKKNALGKIAKVTDESGVDVSYKYDPDGNLLETDFPTGSAVRSTYDARERRIVSDDPDMGQWSYGYDSFGDLITQKDASGVTVSLGYDALGRKVSRTDASGTAEWIYDVGAGAGIGKLAAVIGAPDPGLSAACSIQYATHTDGRRAGRWIDYDDVGLVSETHECVDGETFSTQYEYDAFDRQRVVHYPDIGGQRFAVEYQYTTLGFLHSVTDTSNGKLYWAATNMNAAGQVTAEITGNGVETLSTRNPSTGWLLASSSTAHADGNELIQNWAYRFDEAGNLRQRQRSDQLSAAPNDELFTYDPLNRLTSSDIKVGSAYETGESYQYDSLGNLTQKGTKPYTYTGCTGPRVAGPHALCQIGSGTPFSYDANGNLTNDGQRAVEYDTANKPVHIRSAGNPAGNVDFVYGADGDRVVQSAGPNGGAARTVYVGLGATGKSLYERTSHDGVLDHAHFIYAGDAHAGNAFALHTVTQVGSAAPTAETKYYHYDHLGSVMALSNQSGHVLDNACAGANAEVFGYDAWGARREPAGQATSPPSAFGLPPGHRGFTAHEAIPGVGLVNMNGRVYDPVVGRFLSPDPNVQFASDLQSYNRYSYVLNNPLRYTDPTGYFSVGSFFSNLGVSLAFVAVGGSCAFSGGATCAVFVGIAAAALNATTVVGSGGSFDQALLSFAISGAISNATGGAAGVAIKAAGEGALAQIVGGAAAGALSSSIGAAIHGDKLGWNVLEGAASGAAGAALSWAIAPPVSAAGNAAGEDREQTFRSEVPNIKEGLDLAQEMQNRGDMLSANLLNQLAVEDAATWLDLKLQPGWHLSYDPNLDVSISGQERAANHEVAIGRGGLRIGGVGEASPGYLGASLIHEYTHMDDRVMGRYDGTDINRLANEVRAWKAELASADRLGLNARELRIMTVSLAVANLSVVYHQEAVTRLQDLF